MGADPGIDLASSLRDHYLRVVADVVLGQHGPTVTLVEVKETRTFIGRLVLSLLRRRGFVVATRQREDPRATEAGRSWPRFALSMVGRARLANVRACLEDVISRDVAGDVIEAGAWRGGASIYMRAVLKAWNVSDRRVYVADSFEGLPAPSVEEYPADASAFPFHDVPMLAVSLDDVRANFARFGLADDLVVFVKGWFKDTLPTLSDQRWAVIRLDGDLYESTTQALQALYPNLVPGGWIIIDDYHDIDVCRQAVDDFRTAHSITEPLQDVDWSAVCWQRAE